jgi:hypothetical protein
MKRLHLALFVTLFLALVMVLAGPAHAIEWHTADSVTVTWDPVTADGDGDPISVGTIEYEIVYARLDRSDPVSLWRGADTSAVLTLPTKGRYLLGIKTLQLIDGEVVAESDYGWTDDPAIVADTDGDGTGDVFGIQMFVPPAKATGFAKQ